MDKELLFKPRLPEADVELPGVGTVRVRGLSRAEARQLQGGDPEERERAVIALCMVDPVLTEDEVAVWETVSRADEIELVTDKIGELSGMLPDSAKEAVKEFAADPDAEFRVLPGAEAVDDGGPAARRDEQ